MKTTGLVIVLMSLLVVSCGKDGGGGGNSSGFSSNASQIRTVDADLVLPPQGQSTPPQISGKQVSNMSNQMAVQTINQYYSGMGAQPYKTGNDGRRYFRVRVQAFVISTNSYVNGNQYNQYGYNNGLYGQNNCQGGVSGQLCVQSITAR